MKTLYYETTILAGASQVYDFMLGEETFKRWTAVFSPTSRYTGSWEKGAKICFLSDEADGRVCGMVSCILDNQPPHFVSIEHRGIIEDGKEIMEGQKVAAFAGAKEEYTLLPTDEGTQVKVAMDMAPEWEHYFQETWPKALTRLKTLCEERNHG